MSPRQDRNRGHRVLRAAFDHLADIDETDWKFISRLDEVKKVVREDQAEALA